MRYGNEDAPDLQWFALWTRSRQEKVAAAMLETLEITHYLPMKSELRQWSDRKQMVTVPLFNGYLFVRTDPTKDSRLRILNAPGIAGFVGNHTGPLPIPDHQIETIRTVIGLHAECIVLPHLAVGERVRVIRGALAGIEGVIEQSNSTTRLAISLERIHKSLAVSVSSEDVVPISGLPVPVTGVTRISTTTSVTIHPANLWARTGE